MTIATVGGLTLPMSFWDELKSDAAAPKGGNRVADSSGLDKTALHVLQAALQGIGQAGLTPAQGEAVQSAVEKMLLGQESFEQADSLDSALAAILAAQSKATDQRATLAQSTVLGKFDQLRQQNLKEQEQIRKRVEAEKESGFWSQLVNFFKGLAAALSAVSSVVTGPLGATAAGLLVASLIVSYAVPGEVGTWLSLGLGIGGALCGGVSSLMGEAAQGTARIVATTSRILEMGSNTIASGGAIAKGTSDSRALDAQAALLELKAISKKLLAEAEEEREELKFLLEAMDRGVKVVVKALENNHGATLSALPSTKESS